MIIGGAYLAKGYEDGRIAAQAMPKNSKIYAATVTHTQHEINNAAEELDRLYKEGFLEGLLDFENEFHNDRNNQIRSTTTGAQKEG